MALIFQPNERYTLLRAVEPVESQELIEWLDRLSVNTEPEYSNLIVDLSESAEIGAGLAAFIDKASTALREKGGILIVTGLKPGEEESMQGQGKAIDATFLPSIAEGIDAIFFNDLERQFKEEGGDLNLL
jgi:hypothetical protein